MKLDFILYPGVFRPNNIQVFLELRTFKDERRLLFLIICVILEGSS